MKISKLNKFISINQGFECQECGFNQNEEEKELIQLINIYTNQQKVINRLSRKIQRLKQQTTKHDIKETINLIKFKDKFVNQQLQQTINKALSFIEECKDSLSVNEVQHLKEILKGVGE